MKRLLLSLLSLAPLAVFAAAPTDDWSPNLTAGVAWQNNLSHGEAVWDRISTLQVNADLLASSKYQAGLGDVFHATIHLGGDWVPRFSKLNGGVGGVRGDWQHTFGTDLFAPVFTAELSGDGVATSESARRGAEGAFTLRVAKRFRTGWRTAISERFDANHANSEVFRNRSSETAIEVGRDLNDSTRVTLTGRWRNGDVVTYAQYDRPDLLAIARASEALDTFRTAMTAYAMRAQTVSGRLALVRATSEETATILSYEYGRTTRSGLRFATQTIALSLVRQY